MFTLFFVIEVKDQLNNIPARVWSKSRRWFQRINYVQGKVDSGHHLVSENTAVLEQLVLS